MTDIRRADPAVRRHALVVLVVGACAGVLLIMVFGLRPTILRDWILAEPAASAQRVKVAFLLLAALVLAPLLAFAAYLWSFGTKVLRASEFPPPGLRVVRDTPVITGEQAISRGRLFRVLALVCTIGSVVLGLLLWRLGLLLSAYAA
jgi:hypothetical protein